MQNEYSSFLAKLNEQFIFNLGNFKFVNVFILTKVAMLRCFFIHRKGNDHHPMEALAKSGYMPNMKEKKSLITLL
jgi:hypothetical protein